MSDSITITEKDGGEYWMAVPGFAGSYQVSTAGRVRSCDRLNVNRNGVRRLLRGRPLSISRDGEGYPQVGLLRGGAETKARVHRLVALAFIKNPHALPIVDHRNRNRSDNSVRNLRWATHSQNRQNTSPINPARFHDSDKVAMDDMRRLAEGEAA